MTSPNRQTLLVLPRPSNRTQGLLKLGPLRLRCAIGRSGVTHAKREGDGATPAGRYALVEVRYRADKIARPRTLLPLRRTRRRDGWCDGKGDRNYNRPVALPYPASAETMWRDDDVYDVVVVLDWNLRPRRQNGGSAIFFHLARPGYLPTEGCVAVSRADMLRILRRLRPGAAFEVR
ncbi:MAG: L,D-transpeptidase catalytic domain protein [Kaistia sp. SCN 65-12]|nr:MAG: L,D-transpeptidase catalytic domain protein [Kaistia sp. SCN 65-12]